MLPSIETATTFPAEMSNSLIVVAVLALYKVTVDRVPLGLLATMNVLRSMSKNSPDRIGKLVAFHLKTTFWPTRLLAIA